MVECLHASERTNLKIFPGLALLSRWIWKNFPNRPGYGGICYIVPWRVLSEETSHVAIGALSHNGLRLGFPRLKRRMPWPQALRTHVNNRKLMPLDLWFHLFHLQCFLPYSICLLIDFVVLKLFFTAYNSLPCNILKAKSKKMFAISKLAFKHIADRVSNKHSIALTISSSNWWTGSDSFYELSCISGDSKWPNLIPQLEVT